MCVGGIDHARPRKEWRMYLGTGPQRGRGAQLIRRRNAWEGKEGVPLQSLCNMGSIIPLVIFVDVRGDAVLRELVRAAPRAYAIVAFAEGFGCYARTDGGSRAPPGPHLDASGSLPFRLYLLVFHTGPLLTPARYFSSQKQNVFFRAAFQSSIRPLASSRSHNMLYPREDRAAKKLMYVCRRCHFDVKAESPIVYRNEIVKSEV